MWGGTPAAGQGAEVKGREDYHRLGPLLGYEPLGKRGRGLVEVDRGVAWVDGEVDL